MGTPDDSLNFRFNMEYDKLGRLTSLTYPDGQSVSNVYSEMGYLSAVLKGGTNSAFVQYGKDPGTISAANNVLGTVNSAYDRRAVRRTGNGIMTVIGYEPVTHHPTDVITQNVSATEGDMVGYIYEQTKYTYDMNDNVSKIAYDKYMNADDNSLTQSFTYDGLNRIISANGSYGTKTYEYNSFGNLTKKGDVNLTYGNASHPHAVTGITYTVSGATKSYTYDANGNMTNRNGQILTYDSYDQLRRVETSGKPTEQYTYDHTGTRVKKTRSDGVIVYNIGGLYELAIVPGRSQMHTKYIMGWNGEMVAQTTRDDATLIGALAPNPMIDIRYSPNHTLKIIGEICWTIMRPDREFGIYGRYIPRGLIALGFILLVIGIYYRTVKRRDGKRYGKLAADLAPVILCAFVAFSGTLSCGDILGPYNDLEYDDSGDDNYDPGTVDTTGFPEKGTYYFHPNQVGSAQFVTDSAGRVTYKTAYTPYGEKIADKTEGKKVTHFGYTDQEEDDNTGLMYYGARYYDPEIARFIQADTMVPDPTNAQAFNRYMYCLGNPIRYNDPTGHESEGGYSGGPDAAASVMANEAPHTSGPGSESGNVGGIDAGPSEDAMNAYKSLMKNAPKNITVAKEETPQKTTTETTTETTTQSNVESKNQSPYGLPNGTFPRAETQMNTQSEYHPVVVALDNCAERMFRIADNKKAEGDPTYKLTAISGIMYKAMAYVAYTYDKNGLGSVVGPPRSLMAKPDVKSIVTRTAEVAQKAKANIYSTKASEFSMKHGVAIVEIVSAAIAGSGNPSTLATTELGRAAQFVKMAYDAFDTITTILNKEGK
jgi:RHS repeat-associated protein